jgi:hypothetical protein
MSSALTLPAGQGGIAGEQLPANDEAGSRRSREGRRLRVQGTGTNGPHETLKPTELTEPSETQRPSTYKLRYKMRQR